MTSVKTSSEIRSMRRGGRMLATVLETLRQSVEVGMTTKDLADIAAKELKQLGGKPAFLGYFDFPDVLCVSLNDEVIHGIPSAKKVIEEGDIVSLDFGVLYEGLITDAAITTIAGQGKSRDRFLVEGTRQALETGISNLKNGTRVGELSSKIQQILEQKNLGIVREYVGHGVGHKLHEEPNIPNYGPATDGPILKAGFTIAVEPMATLGNAGTTVDSDGWTVRTVDGSRAAHFEHTILVTNDSYEILTNLE